MAVIIPSLGELKGSIGGNTFQRNRSGQIVRARPRVGKKSTAKQNTAHADIAFWNYMWQQIGETSRGNWNTYATIWTKGNRFGVTKYLTGANWFMSCNAIGALITGTYYSDPQPHTLPADAPAYTVYMSSDKLFITIDPAFDYTNNALGLYVTIPTSRSSNSIQRIRKFAGAFQSDPGTLFEITSIWESATGLDFNATAGFPTANIFFSLLPVALQSNISGVESIFKLNIAEATAWDADMLTYISYFAVPPTDARKILLNQLFIELKAANIFSELDRLYLFASETQQQGNLSLINPGGSAASPTSSPSWAITGYTGDGSSSYVHSNFNPTASGVKYTSNSACMFIYSRNNITENSADFGCFDAASQVFLQSHWSDNNTYTAINTAVINYITGAGVNTHGLLSIQRTGATAEAFWLNGVSTYSNTSASVALANIPVFICAVNSASVAIRFSTREYAFWGAGSSAVDQAQLYSIMHNYLVAIGAD